MEKLFKNQIKTARNILNIILSSLMLIANIGSTQLCVYWCCTSKKKHHKARLMLNICAVTVRITFNKASILKHSIKKATL